MVVLQEVDNKCKRSGEVDQAAELARMTNLQYVFGKAMDDDGGESGQAILSRFPLSDLKVHRLPGEGEPRIAVSAQTETPFGPVTVAGDTDGQPEMCQDMTAAHSDVGVPGCVFDQFMVDLVGVLQAQLPAADFAALTSTTNGTYALTASNAAGIAVGTKFQYSVVPTLFNLRGTITTATPTGPIYLAPTVATSCAS